MEPLYEVKAQFVRDSYKECFDATVKENGHVNIEHSTGTMLQKLEAAKPYNLFYNKLAHVPETWHQENSISFKDLICPSLGKIRTVLHISHICNVRWLMKQYESLDYEINKIDVITKYITSHSNEEHPDPEEDVNDLERFMQLHTNIEWNLIPFQNHFSKLAIFEYDNGSLRFIITGANLCYEDWHYTNNMIWMSPPCPKMPRAKLHINVGPTRFKCHVYEYLNCYDLMCTDLFMDMITFCNFNEVKVHFVATIPGEHYPSEGICTLNSVQDTLSRYCKIPIEDELSWKVVIQTCSVEEYDYKGHALRWLEHIMLPTLEAHKTNKWSFYAPERISCIIYPAKRNVAESVYGEKGGWCLNYYTRDYVKQKEHNKFFYQWKAEETKRSKCLPYFNTYCRVSPDQKKLAYFLLSTARLTKTSWAQSLKGNFCTRCTAYEVGVLFVPKFFGREDFPLTKEADGSTVFPVMYDLPLTAYSETDEPWLTEPYVHKAIVTRSE